MTDAKITNIPLEEGTLSLAVSFHGKVYDISVQLDDKFFPADDLEGDTFSNDVMQYVTATMHEVVYELIHGVHPFDVKMAPYRTEAKPL